MNIKAILLLFLIQLPMVQNGYAQEINRLTKIGIFDQQSVPGYVSDDTFFKYDSESDMYSTTTLSAEPVSSTSPPPFLWKAIQGDFILRAEIKFDEKFEEDPMAGWMLRNSITENESEDDLLAGVNRSGLGNVNESI